jgi:hypothetical protein
MVKSSRRPCGTLQNQGSSSTSSSSRGKLLELKPYVLPITLVLKSEISARKSPKASTKSEKALKNALEPHTPPPKALVRA